MPGARCVGNDWMKTCWCRMTRHTTLMGLVFMDGRGKRRWSFLGGYDTATCCGGYSSLSQAHAHGRSCTNTGSADFKEIEGGKQWRQLLLAIEDLEHNWCCGPFCHQGVVALRAHTPTHGGTHNRSADKEEPLIVGSQERQRHSGAMSTGRQA